MTNTNKEKTKSETSKQKHINKINDIKTDKLMSSKEMPLAGHITNPGNSKLFKTGNWRTYRPIWDEKICVHCMICVNYCPENCIPIDTKTKKRLETNFDFCKGCLICEKECPVKCIKSEREGE